VLEHTRERTDVVRRLGATHGVYVGAVELPDVDVEPAPKPLSSRTSGYGEGEVNDYHPGRSTSRDEGERYARLTLEADEARHQVVTGHGTCRYFGPGYRFDLVGKGGEEIWVDKFGRIKVMFNWDRSDPKDENSSCRVPVSTSWAGKNWGAIQIPRIGEEVIIDFLEGTAMAEMKAPMVKVDGSAEGGGEGRRDGNGGWRRNADGQGRHPHDQLMDALRWMLSDGRTLMDAPVTALRSGRSVAAVVARAELDAETQDAVAAGEAPAPDVAALLAATHEPIADPRDAHRRTAFAQAEEVEFGPPWGLAALAVFFSGGGLAPPSMEPLSAWEFDAARAVGGAISLAAATARPDDATPVPATCTSAPW